MSLAAAHLRLDKWLWFARLFKSRTLAAAFCADGKIRIGHQVIVKPHHPVRIGDVLTFALAGRVRVIKVVAMASRRGPAVSARALYEDLSPPAPARGGMPLVAQRDKGAGRPTKQDRRAIAKLTGRD